MISKESEIKLKENRIQQNLSIDINTARQNVEKAKTFLEEILVIEKKLKLNAEIQSKINVFSKQADIF